MAEWTDSETQILLQFYADHGIPYCRKLLPDKSDRSISAKVKRMGLSRNKEYKHSGPEFYTPPNPETYKAIYKFIGSQTMLTKSERIKFNVKILRTRMKAMTNEEILARANATIKNLRGQL